MEPALSPGRIVFGIPTRQIRPGDIVVFKHEGLDKIKRVKEMRPNEVFLIGDNTAHSTDSRDFGWLERTSIIAKVVWPNLK